MSSVVGRGPDVWSRHSSALFRLWISHACRIAGVFAAVAIRSGSTALPASAEPSPHTSMADNATTAPTGDSSSSPTSSTAQYPIDREGGDGVSAMGLCNYSRSHPTIKYGDQGGAVAHAQCAFCATTTGKRTWPWMASSGRKPTPLFGTSKLGSSQPAHDVGRKQRVCGYSGGA